MKDLDKMNAIADAVGAYQGVSLKEIRSRSRKRPLVDARKYIAYFILEETRSTWSAVGRFLGGKDHATIMHNVRTLKGHIDMYKETRAEVSQIYSIVKRNIKHSDMSVFSTSVGNFMITDQNAL